MKKAPKPMPGAKKKVKPQMMPGMPQMKKGKKK
jgi:hypothetical protein